EAMTLSTRIAVMNGGYVQQLGTPQEIYDTPANIFVATFMGSPAMNVVPAKVEMENGRPVARVALHDSTSSTLPFSQDNMAEWDGKDILLGIRPETITDEDAADRKSANIAQMTNRIVVTEPAGSDTFVTMTLGGKDVIARMRSDAEVHPGADFTFAVNMEKAVAFDPKTETRIEP
ncbi:MAG: TOBE domain-containing protein, partial [Pseudomonadota bacterium]